MIQGLQNLLERLSQIAPDATDDVLSFTEDLTDTMNDKVRVENDYQSLDNTWRERYRQRFYNADTGEGQNDDSNAGYSDGEVGRERGDKEPMTFESLFS